MIGTCREVKNKVRACDRNLCKGTVACDIYNYIPTTFIPYPSHASQLEVSKKEAIKIGVAAAIKLNSSRTKIWLQQF